MTVFDKVLINLHKGFEKLKYVAAIFSERVKVEISLVRTRIRMDTLRARMNELHAGIGRRLVSLRAKAALPESVEQLLGDEEISTALSELVQCEKDLEELSAHLRSEAASVEPAPEEEERPL